MRFYTLLGFGAALVIGAAGVQAQQAKQLSIATGGTGGVYYPLGGGFGNILGKELPGVDGDCPGHGRLGRQPAADRLGQGRPLLHPGRRRLGRRERPRQVRERQAADPRARGDVSELHARGDGGGHRHQQGRGPEGQARLDRLAGQRHGGVRRSASSRRPGSTRTRTSGASGSASPSASTPLKDKKIDAFFFVVGLPTPSITDLAATPNTKIKLLDHAQYLDKMVAKYGNDLRRGHDPARRPTRAWTRTPRASRCGTSWRSTPAPTRSSPTT